MPEPLTVELALRLTNEKTPQQMTREELAICARPIADGISPLGMTAECASSIAREFLALIRREEVTCKAQRALVEAIEFLPVSSAYFFWRDRNREAIDEALAVRGEMKAGGSTL